jgi:hypothetical protein
VGSLRAVKGEDQELMSEWKFNEWSSAAASWRHFSDFEIKHQVRCYLTVYNLRTTSTIYS